MPFSQISLKNSELKLPPTIPFGIVECTFSNNLSRNSCIQLNFVENIRQLKILGSCPVTVIYRAIIYRFDKNKVNVPVTKLMMAKGADEF